MNVLNPELYQRLKRHFRHVKISNEGEAMIYRAVQDPITDRPRLDITQDGEYYCINCPYCLDTRFRLYINHMWGKRDESGRRLRFLAICYNESCMDRPDNRADLQDILSATDGSLEQARIFPGKELSGDVAAMRLPGLVKTLDQLPGNHLARLYVESRGFDPDRLAKAYGVGFCTDSVFFLARQRLIIPIKHKNKLAGWQARYVGELDWRGSRKADLPPKYFTAPGMRRSQFLANLDKAKHFHTGVLVEGWFDVFGFGPMAMPVLGSTVATLQQREFVATFSKRAGVLLLDPEEIEKRTTVRLVEQLMPQFSGNFAAIKLPRGTDPGSLARDFLREYVADAAKDQGVQVSWGRIK